MTFRQVHRWVSLTVAAIWLVQAITGILSVFRWEIDDWTVAGEHVPVDLKAVGARVDARSLALECLKKAPKGS